MAYSYFYDGQIRRFLLQIVRAFTGFQYQVAGRNGGSPELRQVPCRMATMNRQVGQIMRNNSENALLTVPMITVWIKEMNPARERTQNPSHVDYVHVNEREFGDTTQTYTDQPGNSYTVERKMPHPLDITIEVDVWTSNEHQKHQLFEQIYMAFNVGFDIQSSDNPIDWTALTTMTMDSLQWSSRSIPVGTNDEIDVSSFTFKLPVWITPPAKMKQQKLIQQIVTNIHMASADFDDSDTVDGPEKVPNVGGWNGVLSSVTTPQNARITIDSGNITLMDEKNHPMAWGPFLAQYGTMVPSQSQLRLRANIEQDVDLDIIGTIQYTADPNIVQWTVDPDTLPSNTMSPVNAIIDPLKHFPSQVLPSPATGQRYLILSDMGSSQAWGDIRAYAGDIIEYQDGVWKRVFDCGTNNEVQYLVNLKTNKQLKFTNGQWIMAIDGEYNPGYWRLRL